MHYNSLAGLRRRLCVGASVSVLAAIGLANSAYAADPDKAVDAIRTATPIKHVIIIVGENRSFDHIFATYVPKKPEEKVRNLLSEGIVNADGSPGPNFAKAHQFQITSAPNFGKFFISADRKDKTLHTTLPAPDIGGVPAGDRLVTRSRCQTSRDRRTLAATGVALPDGRGHRPGHHRPR